MSIGYGAHAFLIASDDAMLLYNYGCFDIDDPNYTDAVKTLDGEISIERDALVEPSIHLKIKKMPSGRKREIVKRVPIEVDYNKLFESGKITVKNAGATWKTLESGVDVMAFKVIFKLFNEYQETGEIPEIITVFS